MHAVLAHADTHTMLLKLGDDTRIPWRSLRSWAADVPVLEVSQCTSLAAAVQEGLKIPSFLPRVVQSGS